MILIFLSVIFLAVINFGCGFLCKKILRIETENFTSVSLLGIIGITLPETVFAFLFPLDSYVEIIFIVLGLFGFLMSIYRKELFCKLLIINNVWFYFFLIVAIFVASFVPYFFDHYSYYIPTISYLNKVGFVRGISNLDLLLGQTSFWHIYQAGFSHFLDSFLRINAYLLVLFLLYVYEKKKWNLLLFFPFFLLFTQQPSPDLPVMIFSLIIINELILKKNNYLVLILSLFVFCIKPVVFWLPLFVISEQIFSKKFKIKMKISILIFGILFVAKNLCLFGFPVFPVSFPDFGLAWKPDEKILTYSSQIGLMKSYDMKYSYQQILEFNAFDKIFHWFIIGYKSIFNFGILICLIILGFFAVRKKDGFYKILFACLLIKTILILTFSAQYRFFFDVFATTIFLISYEISKKKSVIFSVVFSLIILLVFSFPEGVKTCFPQFHLGKYLKGFSGSQILKPGEISEINISKEYQLGNLKFNSAKGLNYKVPFPAIALYQLKIYQYYGVFPQRAENGFVQKNLSEKEKKELAEIISDVEK